VIFVTTVVSAFLLLSAATALRPGRAGVVKAIAFPVGWAAGELAGHAIVFEGALVAVQWWWGWPGGGMAVALLALAGLVVVANVALVVTQLRARTLTRRAMTETPRNPITVRTPRDDAFATWWRTLVQFPFHPRDLHVTRDVAYGDLARHRLDIWQMGQPENAPVIFFVHGGAWVIGDKREQGRPMLHEFVSRGWVVVAPNYRLAPTHPWPAQIEDVVRAFAWVKQSIHLFGGDPTRVVVAGASAGGQLAALLALAGDDPAWRPAGAPANLDLSVRGCISQYGVLEMTGDRVIWDGHGGGIRTLLEDKVVQLPIAGHEDLYRSISPIERLTHSAPPFLVIQGANDTLVDVEVARHFVARFRDTASASVYYVELPFTQHAFDLTASVRTSAVVRTEIAFAEAAVAPVPSSTDATLPRVSQPH
jgi:acetyl esterase/lipase